MYQPRKSMELVLDAFYCIRTDLALGLLCPELEWFHNINSALVPRRSYEQFAYATETVLLDSKSEEVEQRICDKCSTKRPLSSRYTWATIDLIGYRPVREFIPCMMAHLVAPAFAEQLKKTSFKRFAFFPVDIEVDQTDSGIQQVLGVNYLSTLRKRFLPQWDLVVPSENACPKCGLRPAVCNVCRQPFPGKRHSDSLNCPQCDWSPMEENPEIPIFDELGYLSYSEMIPGEFWDGSDFFNNDVVTRHVVDWILDVEAGPFVGQPRPVDISRCDTMQRERILSLSPSKTVYSWTG
jgi:hypothetical protein